MYEMMKNVILSKKLSVNELTQRINVFYAQGTINADEKAELDDLVFANQTIDVERDTLEALYRALALKYADLEERVIALEGGTGDGDPGADDTGYPEWKAWDGISTDYQTGAVVRHNGKLWRNVLEGLQNVWEPGVVDNRYWIEVIE